MTGRGAEGNDTGRGGRRVGERRETESGGRRRAKGDGERRETESGGRRSAEGTQMGRGAELRGVRLEWGGGGGVALGEVQSEGSGLGRLVTGTFGVPQGSVLYPLLSSI